MASSQPASSSGGNSQSPGPELSKPVYGNEQNVKEETAGESSEKTAFAMPEPMREELVQSAVNFLSHPRVKGSPIIYRRSFLEKKGLTKEEIDEAFRRAPDPPSNVKSVEGLEAATTDHAALSKSSIGMQSQALIQTPPPAPVTGASMVPSLQKPRFQWSHVLFSACVLAASGSGTAVLFKNGIVPRFKAWIRKVAAEKSETEKENKSISILAAEAAEAAKAAAEAAAVVAKASQESLNARNEERKYFGDFMGMIDIQVKEMKTMGEAIRKLESTSQKSYSQDKLIEDHVQSTSRSEMKYFDAFKSMIDVQVKEMKSMGDAIRNLESTKGKSYSPDKLIEEHVQSTLGNATTSNLLRNTQASQSDAGLSPILSKQVNGTTYSDIGAVRLSSTPASMDPIPEPLPKSYMEIFDMIQRGEKPPGIKEINDTPPNPNQPPSKPRFAPRPKPWQIAQQRTSYSFQSRSSGEGLSSSEAQENGSSSQPNGKALDVVESWSYKAETTPDAEPEAEDLSQFSYNTGPIDRPRQRGWVPPQPPSVVLPEAAAAIRQSKPSIKKQQLPVIRSDDEEGGAVNASSSAVEVETNGGEVMDLKQIEIKEEQADGVEMS